MYRVAQEALTNVARHSNAPGAELALARHENWLTLTVRGRGRGLPEGIAPGTGMRGMRERAALIGARLQIGKPTSGGGCEVRLDESSAEMILAHDPRSERWI